MYLTVSVVYLTVSYESHMSLLDVWSLIPVSYSAVNALRALLLTVLVTISKSASRPISNTVSQFVHTM